MKQVHTTFFFPWPFTLFCLFSIVSFMDLDYGENIGPYNLDWGKDIDHTVKLD